MARVSEIKTVDGLTGIECRCGRFAAFGAAGVAQMAMGHVVHRTCECGEELAARRVASGRYSIRTRLPALTAPQRVALEAIRDGRSPYVDHRGRRRPRHAVNRVLGNLCDMQMIGLNPGWVLRPAGQEALEGPALAAQMARVFGHITEKPARKSRL